MPQTRHRYGWAAGVTERKARHPHTLSHVFASELLSGANLREMHELLGHKHLDSGQRARG